MTQRNRCASTEDVLALMDLVADGQTDLRNSTLRGATLTCAWLGDVDLSGADLRGADLRDAWLCGANLCSADLSRADLEGAHLAGADLTSADLRRAWLSGTDLSRAVLERADLRMAVLHSVRLERASVAGARFHHTHLDDLDLTEAEHLDETVHLGFSNVDVDTLLRTAGSLSRARDLESVVAGFLAHCAPNIPLEPVP